MCWGCLLLRTDAVIKCLILPKFKRSGVIYVIAWEGVTLEITI